MFEKNPKVQSIELDLFELVEQVVSGKNTSALYQLKQTIERVSIKEKSIYQRNVVLKSIERLKDLVSSKSVIFCQIKKFNQIKLYSSNNRFLRLLESLLRKTIEIDDDELCTVIVQNVQVLEEFHMIECLKYFLR